MKREELIDMIMDHSAGATDNVADGVCYKMLADSILKRLSLPPAEGAEEIFNKYQADAPMKTRFINFNEAIKAMQEFATLHARKMARENLREELIKYDEWAVRHLFGSEEIFSSARAVDEYFKSKEQ